MEACINQTYQTSVPWLSHDYIKGYCHHRRDDIKSCAPRLVSALLSTSLTSSQPQTTRFLGCLLLEQECNSTLIKKKKKIPILVSLYPQVKMTFHKMSFRPCYACFSTRARATRRSLARQVEVFGAEGSLCPVVAQTRSGNEKLPSKFTSGEVGPPR